MTVHESNQFEDAVRNGGEGLVGVDGSGNDWEFSQDIGSVAVEAVISDEEAEQ